MVNIPIFLASDNNYAPFVATAIASICDNTDSYCEFYVLDGGISEENKERICNLKKQFDNFSVTFVKIDTEKYFKNFIVESYITVATYYRFVIADLFPDLEKVLYLDVDIIAQGDILDLYNVDLENYILGAVIDQGDKLYISRLKKNLDMNIFSHYFNAGVLLLDLKKWREDNISKKLFEIEKKYRGNLLCNDQDVLNKLFENNYKELPIRCNSMLTNDSALIRHFYNRIKPWNVAESLCVDEYKDFALFWYYAKLVGITDKLDCKYKTSHQFQFLNLYKRIAKNKCVFPKVSVIIPIYKVENYLRKCLDSVCNQTLKDIEIICINDGSSDASLAILNEYALGDARIKIVNSIENRGASISRNMGIEVATGEYIGFVDGDDFVDLDFYEKLYNKAKETDADIAKGNIYDCDKYGKQPVLTSFYNMNDKIRENKAYFYYGFTSAIYKRTLIETHKIRFPEHISHFEDPYFSIQVAIYQNKIVFDDTARYFYIKHEASACSTSKTLSKTQDFSKVVSLIFDILNQAQISKEEYFIYLSFLYEQLEPWCYDIALPEKANSIAQDTLIALLKNKYGMESFLKFYFIEKNSLARFRLKNNKKNIMEMLRKKVKK